MSCIHIIRLVCAAATLSCVPAWSAEKPTSDPMPANAKPLQDCRQCPAMVVIPAGQFTMGYEGDQNAPPHNVKFEKPFAIGTYEVMAKDWQACVADQACSADVSLLGDGGRDANRLPVTDVSWNAAQKYVKWLSKVTGKRYRLPSEAEWEYAARAGSGGAYFHGDAAEQLCKYANVNDQTRKAEFGSSGVVECKDGFAALSPAGRFKPNAFGLFDVQGNVHEWVEDCYVEKYTGTPVDGSAHNSEKCDFRVFRGGDFGDAVSITSRNAAKAFYAAKAFGFRVARDLD